MVLFPLGDGAARGTSFGVLVRSTRVYESFILADRSHIHEVAGTTAEQVRRSPAPAQDQCDVGLAERLRLRAVCRVRAHLRRVLTAECGQGAAVCFCLPVDPVRLRGVLPRDLWVPVALPAVRRIHNMVVGSLQCIVRFCGVPACAGAAVLLVGDGQAGRILRIHAAEERQALHAQPAILA